MRIVALALGFGMAVAICVELTRSGNPVDAGCYYSIDLARPYATECWLYAPPFALVMGLIQGAMPFGAFAALLRAAEMGSLMAIVGPAAGALAFVPQVATELNAVNINLILLLAVLAGVRHPWTWSFVILAKITPGVGLLWFVARREWRRLAVALLATAAVAGASAVAAPWMWADYVAKLAVTPDHTGWPVGMRLPLAALIVIWGARTDRRWVLPIALFLSLPRLYFLSPVVLVGVLPFIKWSAVRDALADLTGSLRRRPGSSAAETDIQAPAS